MKQNVGKDVCTKVRAPTGYEWQHCILPSNSSSTFRALCESLWDVLASTLLTGD